MKVGKVDPVKKWMDRYHRPKTHPDLTKYNRKKGLFKEWMDEDAPVNATGAAVSTDKPIVKKKKKKKNRDNDWSLGAGHNEIGTPDIVKRFKNGTPMESKQSEVKKVLARVKGVSQQQAQIISTLPMPVLTQVLSALSLVMGEERDYKKEYDTYHSKPEQKKRRAGRNRARSMMKNSKGIKGKDVHHKDGNPENNDKKNLSIVTQHYNRREPRLREASYESLTSAQKVQLLKLYSKGMDLMYGTPAFKKNQAEIDKLRKKFKLEELDEGKLVTDFEGVLDYILKGLRSKMGKEYQKNTERGIAFVNQVSKLVKPGMKASVKGQAKGRVWLKT